MSIPRAMQIGHEIMEIGISYRRSMDAKSSESQRNVPKFSKHIDR